MSKISLSYEFFIFSIILLLIGFASTQKAPPYIFNGNPYLPGSFKIDRLEVLSRPFHTVVHYPISAGTYSVQIFVGGFYGLLLSGFYQEYLTNIAQHGIIVIGVDSDVHSTPSLRPFIPNYSQYESVHSSWISEGVVETLNWLHQNLYYELEEKVRAVRPDFNSLLLACHSSGCEIALQILNEHNSLFNAAIFMDPERLQFNGKVNYSIPTLFIGTQYPTSPEWCTQPILPYYDNWSCPKAVVNITGYGHCDLLDIPWFEACWFAPPCKIASGDDIETFHIFEAGINVAWTAAFVQGNCKELTYVLDQSTMPLQMEYIKSDLRCKNNCISPQ